jgi:hypothetical protein
MLQNLEVFSSDVKQLSVVSLFDWVRRGMISITILAQLFKFKDTDVGPSEYCFFLCYCIFLGSVLSIFFDGRNQLIIHQSLQAPT